MRFLRESKKYFPKVVRPMASVNPVFNYMSNKHHKPEELTVRRTMKYQNCSQIVPTVGLNNLVLYDCHNENTSSRMKRSFGESFCQLLTTSNARGSTKDLFLTQDANEKDDLFTGTSNNTLDWMKFGDLNLTSQTQRSPTLRNDSVDIFTVNDSRPDLASSLVSSYSFFEMGLNNRQFDEVPSSDIYSYELDLDQQMHQSKNDEHCPQVGTFDMNLRQRNSDWTGIESFNVTEICSALNLPEWHMTSALFQSHDESTEKFAVSSYDMTQDAIDEHGSYSDFNPLVTSTPKSRKNSKRWNSENHQLSDFSQWMNIVDEGSLLNQRIGQTTTNFSVLDTLDDFDEQFFS
ncbi:hypothetical protein Bhyg_12599 [Pseudolycoriella hygida]|uniref:Uncharacterized protein n=1 Tax=Pseudolycoriella hygida TaxID=35572 RepID=A0A9Q0MZW0_9DIPT|nr:hypothetical protein Bhyg_12599 [Pseudolycoriella hygida]